MEGGFVQASVEIVVAESLKYESDVFLVVAGIFREDKYIVEIYNDELVRHIREYIVHEVLKRRGGIGHAEGHYKVLERAVAGAERGFPLIALADSDIVVASAEVDFGVDFRVAEAIEEVTYEWEWVLIPFGDGVQVSVVDAEAEGAVFLLREEDWSAGWGVRGTNKTFSQHVLEIFSDVGEFSLGNGVDAAEWRILVVFEVNGMIVGTMRRHLGCLGL